MHNGSTEWADGLLRHTEPGLLHRGMLVSRHHLRRFRCWWSGSRPALTEASLAAAPGILDR
jgi:hypothetical protein